MARLDANPHAPPATPEHVARLLAEASSVTSVTNGGQVELQLGHFCNNRCVFCASGQLTEQGHATPVPDAAVDRALTSAAKAGLHRVVFLGGEPTIQASFLPSLKRARELGFGEITVFTNGARIGDARFVDAVVAHGPIRWRVSIQGGDATAHDRIVGQTGAFARIVRGLRLLRQRQQDVTVNMCLTTAALPTLPLLADLVLDHGVRQLCIDMVRPVSAGERSEAWLKSIMPRFADLVGPLTGLLARLDARAPGFDVNLTHLPFCVLPGEAHRIHHGGEPTVTFTADLAERQGAMDKYAFQADDRAKLPSCSDCLLAHRCTGVPHVYAHWHGGGELQPLTAQVLARRDPAQSAFTDVMRGFVAGLSEVVVVADPRQRRIELRLPEGSLWLLPRATATEPALWPLVQGPTWRLAATARALNEPLHKAAVRLARQLPGDNEVMNFDGPRLRYGLAWLARLEQRWRHAPQVQLLRRTSTGLSATLMWQARTVELDLAAAAHAAPIHGRCIGGLDIAPEAGSALSTWLGEELRTCRPPTKRP